MNNKTTERITHEKKHDTTKKWRNLSLSFGQRIFLAIVTLLIILQVTTTVILYYASYENIEKTVIDNLNTGLKIFSLEFSERKNYLKGSVEIISKDWAFREALGQKDEATTISVLNNHRHRVRADIGLYISTDSSTISSTEKLNSKVTSQLIHFVQENDNSSVMLTLNDTLYQFVFSQVKAPITIGWIAMGFAIDDSLAKTFSNTTNLSISFILKDNITTTITASSLTGKSKSVLLNWLTLNALDTDAITPTNHYNLQTSDLNLLMVADTLQHIEQQTLYILLQKSIHEPIQEFKNWWINLQWIFFAILVISAFIAAWVAKSITTPLTSLLHISKKMSTGDYSITTDISSHDEVGALAQEFNNMQYAVAEREREIRFRADHDQLTGLFNRDSFIQKLDDAIASESGKLIAIIQFNLNSFRDINDTLGHDIGDQLLLQVSERLQQYFPQDQLTRHGADQFAVFTHINEFHQLQQISHKIDSIFTNTFDACGIKIQLRAAQGLSLFPEHSKNALGLMRMAEVAMYNAKEKNLSYCIYDLRQDKHSVQRLTLMSELPNAINSGEMTLYYQPTLHLTKKNKKIVKVECLTRWNHPQHGLIPPDDFINLAEQSGAIVALTNWALDTALKQCLLWRQEKKDINVAVNISAVDLFSEELVELVPTLLKKYQLSGQVLTLEVTETEIMKDPERACQVLNSIRKHNVRLSIDDYGTGYSSLAQMKKLPVDELKIDKSFIMDLINSQDDQAIVISTIDLAHTMGLAVVAEGVESSEILEYLQALKCDYAQGYYIAKPLSITDLTAWLDNTLFDIKNLQDDNLSV